MLIDCDTCAARDVRCGDCVISVFLTLPRRVEEPVEIDDAEQGALDALMAAGLVPPLRLVALDPPADPERGIA